MLPTTKIIAISTGPYLTTPARPLYTMLYCKPKGRVRQHRDYKGRGLLTSYVGHCTTPEIHRLVRQETPY